MSAPALHGRRRLLRLTALACAPVLSAANGALAQTADTYPTKQIRLILPYTAGSGIDITARMVAEKLPATLGGPLVMVENRPGASGIIGTGSVARAAPDGLTLMAAPTTHVITAAVRKLDYDPINDFTPIAAFARGAFIVVVPADSRAGTLADLVQLLKAAKGELSYSSAGIASTVHLFTEMLLQTVGAKARHIPSKGISGALMDVMQAQVDFMVAPMELGSQQFRSGKIRVLAQTNSSRYKKLPEVPTVAESGYPGFEAVFWMGFYAPARTPPAIVAKLNGALNALLTRPDVLQALDQWALEPMGGTPEQFAALNKADLARYSAIANSSNITTD